MHLLAAFLGCLMYNAWQRCILMSAVMLLQMNNFTPQPQEVQVAVQETQGFIFSGDKQQTMTLMPRDATKVQWLLVAHVSGQLPLPTVKVSAVRLNCSTVTQSSNIHVMPF